MSIKIPYTGYDDACTNMPVSGNTRINARVHVMNSKGDIRMRSITVEYGQDTLPEARERIKKVRENNPNVEVTGRLEFYL